MPKRGPSCSSPYCIVRENAVLRGVHDYPLSLGDHVLVGPHAYLVGCSVADAVFLATGAALTQPWPVHIINPDHGCHPGFACWYWRARSLAARR